MSLTLLSSTNPCFYELCQPGDGAVYSSYLCTPPRIYREELFSPTTSTKMYYSETLDKYVVVMSMAFSLFPGSRTNYYFIDPRTGLSTVVYDPPWDTGFAHLQDHNAGPLKKVYARYFLDFVEFQPHNATMTDAQVANPLFSSADVGGSSTGPFMINRTRKLCVRRGSSGGQVEVWNYQTATKVGDMIMPGIVQQMSYETEDVAWFGYNGPNNIGSFVQKVNWVSQKSENYWYAQPGAVTADLDTHFAFDTKRKHLGILRIKANATDGESLHEFDIYSTVFQPSVFTNPVPTRQLRVGQTHTLIANVTDETGNSGIGIPVTASNTNGNQTLQFTSTTSTARGRVTFPYICGSTEGTDTISLEATI